MCCCIFRKGSVCQARWWHAAIYLTLGVIVLFCYLGISIAFYLECYALNAPLGYPFECGSTAMWTCMGWVPLFFFFIITGLTFFYYFKQSSRTTKLITTSDAWLILFITIACCILFFIHICYLAYISAKLLDNPGCNPEDKLYEPGLLQPVSCDKATELISALLFFAISLIIFICASLTILFALVNQRIATPVNYKTVSNTNVPDGVADEAETQRIRAERMENLAAHKMGARVIVRLSYDDKTGCYGTVRWYGPVTAEEYPTESTTTLPFLYGVHLDEKRGNCDGSLPNKHPRPFNCPQGFGVFVPINHIKPLLPENDPTKKHLMGTAAVEIVRNGHVNPHTKQRSSVNEGLLITRGQEPNHLFQGNLFFFLRKLRYAGVVNCAKIGVIDESTKIEKMKTKSMINVIFPTTNECIYNYLPLLSSMSAYDEIFNPERGSQILRKQSMNDTDHILDEQKGKEEDDNVPCVNIWYLNLHECWAENSAKIRSIGIQDYQSAQWVAQSEARALEWYKMLGIETSEALKQAQRRFDETPLPLFLKRKQQILGDDDDMKTINYDKQTLYSNICCHYVPIGIFHDCDNISKHEVKWLEGPPIPSIIDEINMKIELRLKRLIHEPVMTMQCILPYLHSQQYTLDSSDDKYGWFPIDWVYAEVDIVDSELQTIFANVYRNYTPPFDDDVDIGGNSYNPYWFMKAPRIPLFVLSLRLPLRELKKYAVKLINVKYGQSPVSRPINTSISIDENERERHRHRRQKKSKSKKKHKHKHFKNESEYERFKHKYQMPPKPRAKYKRASAYDNEEVTVSIEMEDMLAMEDKSFKHRHKRHKQSKNSEYRHIGNSDEEQGSESETDSQYSCSEESGSDSSNEMEESLSNDESDEYTEGSTDSEEECTSTGSENEEFEETENSESEAHGTVTFKRKAGIVKPAKGKGSSKHRDQSSSNRKSKSSRYHRKQ